MLKSDILDWVLGLAVYLLILLLVIVADGWVQWLATVTLLVCCVRLIHQLWRGDE